MYRANLSLSQPQMKLQDHLLGLQGRYCQHEARAVLSKHKYHVLPVALLPPLGLQLLSILFLGARSSRVKRHSLQQQQQGMLIRLQIM